VFEQWSKAKTALFALPAEKARDGLFQHVPGTANKSVAQRARKDEWGR
jgi:hypothetical protein